MSTTDIHGLRTRRAGSATTAETSRQAEQEEVGYQIAPALTFLLEAGVERVYLEEREPEAGMVRREQN